MGPWRRRIVVDAVDAALPGGAAVLALTRHPVPEVRRAAVLAASPPATPRRSRARPRAAGRSGFPGRERRSCRARPPQGRTAAPVFTVLGGFALRRGAFSIDDDAWRHRAAQRLVRILLVHRDAAMSEDTLFAALWPDKTGAAARRNLQVIVSAARAVLDWPRTEHSVLLVARRTYRLELAEARRRGRRRVRARGPPRSAHPAGTGPALLEAAASRWTGKPLPEDRYEDWALPARERLIDVYGRALTALADARSAGDHPGAVDAHRRHIELDPLDEAAQRGLMLAYARSGRRSYALRQYLACRRALLDGLGIEPAQKTAALQRLILADEPV